MRQFALLRPTSRAIIVVANRGCLVNFEPSSTEQMEATSKPIAVLHDPAKALKFFEMVIREQDRKRDISDSYGIQSAAEFLNVKIGAIIKAYRSGKLPYRLAGSRYIFTKSDLLAWRNSLPVGNHTRRRNPAKNCSVTSHNTPKSLLPRDTSFPHWIEE